MLYDNTCKKMEARSTLKKTALNPDKLFYLASDGPAP